MWATLALTDDFYLNVFEYVVVRDGRPQVEKYSYYLIHRDGYEIWGFGKDPKHDPAIHGHIGADHRRVPADEVSFKWVAAQAWQTVGEEEILPPASGAGASGSGSNGASDSDEG